jgi:DNA-binding IclR family transcriptional regulator
MIKKPLFNTKSRTILHTLQGSRRGLTIYDISKKTGIAWVTTKKYLKDLEEKKLVIIK